ncbi:uncharacterized protein LOC141719603 [Apium graveolens]|uniref:uncharacterized protein LOC141719603 n=1 Tax=Apium graveolens TaxID=4045 RepID=UPI003D7A7CB8
MINHMNSELYNAVISDDIDVLNAMQRTTSLEISNQRTPTGSTMLHLACQYGSSRCVEEILSVHESLLCMINSRDETALHLAARHGHYKVVEALILKAKTPIQQLNYLQYTASTLLQILIRTETVELETALHTAVRYNHNNVVELLVKEDPGQPHIQNKYKETPLYMASVRNNTDIIKTILHNCELPDLQQLLLEKRKELINVADNHGWTAFHFVAHSDACTLVKDLVSAGKAVGYRPDKRYKRIPLHLAAFDGNVKVMEELVKYDPDTWEILDGKGRNILHMALEKDRTRVISFILSRGFKANNNLFIQRDNEGNTPLHLMAKLRRYLPEIMNHSKVYSELDCEIINDEHLSPLDVLYLGQQTDTTANMVSVFRISKALIKANIKQHWDLWHGQRQTDVEKGAILEKHYQQIGEERINRFKNVINARMVVAALIATVALTAGFAMPGGFNEQRGYPGLLRKAAFKAFVLTDAIALLSSVSALLLYFVTTMISSLLDVKRLIIASASLNVVSIIAMMLTFSTGTYAVLAPSSDLAISVCVLSSVLPLPFFIMFFPFFRRVFSLLFLGGPRIVVLASGH